MPLHLNGLPAKDSSTYCLHAISLLWEMQLAGRVKAVAKTQIPLLLHAHSKQHQANTALKSALTASVNCTGSTHIMYFRMQWIKEDINCMQHKAFMLGGILDSALPDFSRFDLRNPNILRRYTTQVLSPVDRAEQFHSFMFWLVMWTITLLCLPLLCCFQNLQLFFEEKDFRMLLTNCSELLTCWCHSWKFVIAMMFFYTQRKMTRNMHFPLSFYIKKEDASLP